MLNVLRENLKKRAWTKWLLLLVAGSMTLYLAAYFGGGGGGEAQTATGDWAARVGGETIPSQEYLQLARRLDQSYRQLFGQNYGEMRNQFQIGSQAMRQLVEQEVILRDARRLGLSVSEDELIERIRTAPGLTDPAGNFVGKAQYEERLNGFYPGGVSAFERELSNELLIEKWTDLVSQAITADEASLEALFRQQNEKTTVSYFVVASADQDVETSINDEDVELWYAEHAEDYTRGEGRRIRMVTVGRQSSLDEIEISEDAVQSAYQASQAKYAHPEQRRASHILFRVSQGVTDEEREQIRQKATDTMDRVASGEDFATLAIELSEDTFSGQKGGDLDWFSRGDMVGPFDEAAFGNLPGSAPVLVETQFGYHIVKVTDKRDAGAVALEEVRDDIVAELRLAQAEELMEIDARRIRDRMNGPDDFEAIVTEEGLTIDSRFVNESQGLADLGASTEFRAVVLEMGAGEISAPLRLSRGLAVVVVDELVPESVAPLEEVSLQVRTDLLNARALEAAISSAQNGFDLHDSLIEAAESLGEEIRDSGELGPGQSLPGTGGGVATLRDELFGDTVEVGDTGVVEVPAGALVYEVSARQPFDRILFESEREDLRTQLMEQKRLALRRSMVDQLSRDLDIVVNEELVQRVDGGA